jgi:MbtH protein
VSDTEQEDDQKYRVVVNDEEQYSIWPLDREPPPGWRDGGASGTKAQCLEYISQVWTDMRPLSLRKAMEETPRRPTTSRSVTELG